MLKNSGSRRRLLEVARGINNRVEPLFDRQSITVEEFKDAEASLRRALGVAELFPTHPESARSYFNLGRLGAFLDPGRDTESFVASTNCYRKALEIQQHAFSDAHPRTGDILNHLGYLLRLKGDHAGALECFIQAVDVRRKILDADDPELAQSLGNLGITLLDLGRIREAQPHLEEALEIRVKKLGLENPDTAAAFEALGALHRESKDLKNAQSHYEQALRINAKVFGPEHPRVALGHSHLGNLLSELGRYGEARAHLEHALAVNEAALGSRHPETANSFNNLGCLFQRCYKWKEARSFLEKALSMDEEVRGTGHPATIMKLNNLGTFLKTIGDERAAMVYLNRALDASEKVFGRIHPITFNCLHNLGRFEEALAVRRQLFGAEHPATEGYMVKVLASAVRRGGFESSAKAATVLEDVLRSQEERFGEGHILTAETHHSLAVALHSLALVPRETVESHYASAVRIRAEKLGEEDPSLVGPLRDYGQYLLFMKDDREAVKILERCLRISEKTIGVECPNTIQVLERLCYCYARMKDSEKLIEFLGGKLEAEEKWLASVLVVGSSREKELRIQSLAGLDGNLDYVSYHMDMAPQDERAARLAFTAILQRKARVVDVSSQELQILRKHLDDQGRQLLEELLEGREAKVVLMLREPELHTAELAEIEARVEEKERELAQCVESRPRFLIDVDLEAVRSKIPKKAALVEIFTYMRLLDGYWMRDSQRYVGEGLQGGDHYVAYILHGSGEVCWVDLGEVPAIRAAVGAMRDAISHRQSDVRRRARELDELTMAKIRPLLRDVEQLIISPDADLHLVPFAALVDEDGHYLAERYGLSYVTSGRDLLRFSEPGLPGEEPLVMGDPDFDGECRSTLPETTEASCRVADLEGCTFDRLPGTAAEVAGIGRVLNLPKDRLLTGPDATEMALKAARGPRILHLATHGFFGSRPAEPKACAESRHEDPLIRSGVVLAGGNRHRECGDAQDGIVTALEVMGLDLWGTEIAVLSACETGVGEVSYGQGIFGLRRALVLAGARTQVLSLWKVADEGTKDLMISFYRQLVQGVPPAEAMQNVQLAAIRAEPLPMTEKHLSARGGRRLEVSQEADDSRVAGSRHPYYWASFVVSGDTGLLPNLQGDGYEGRKNHGLRRGRPARRGRRRPPAGAAGRNR